MPALKLFMMTALVSWPLSPVSQSMATSRSASLARHQLLATTATNSPMLSTLTMPRRFSTLDASKDLTLPLNTGLAATAAYIMPGTWASMP